jgi:hypothetical protein
MRRTRPGQVRAQHAIARAHAERPQRQVQRARAIGHGDRMTPPGVSRDLRLEFGDARALHQHSGA